MRALPADPAVCTSIAAQQREAVEMRREIVNLAGEIRFRNTETADFVKVSSTYGLDLYRIYQAYINLNLAGLKADPEKLGDLLKKYDAAWDEYRELVSDHPNCASLYEAHGARFGVGDGLEKVVARAFPSNI